MEPVGEQAVELLRRIVERDPVTVTYQGDYDLCCYFCGTGQAQWGGSLSGPHTPDCPYVLAKQLLELAEQRP